MPTRGRLLAPLLVILFIMMAFIPGCQPGKEAETQEVVEEMIEENAPTQEPTQAPTPDKTKLYFSGEMVEKMQALWPAQNTGVDTFGDNFAVFLDNGLMGDGNYLTFRFMPGLSVPDIQDQFSASLYSEGPSEQGQTPAF